MKYLILVLLIAICIFAITADAKKHHKRGHHGKHVEKHHEDCEHHGEHHKKHHGEHHKKHHGEHHKKHHGEHHKKHHGEHHKKHHGKHHTGKHHKVGVKKIVNKHFYKITKQTTSRIVQDVCGFDRVCAKQVKEHCTRFFKHVAKHGRIEVTKLEKFIGKVCAGRDEICVDTIQTHLDYTPLNFHHAKKHAERVYRKTHHHVKKGIKKIIQEACRNKSEKCVKRVTVHSKVYFSEGVEGKHHYSSHKKFAARICKDASCRVNVHKITKHTFGKIKHYHHKANHIIKTALPPPIKAPVETAPVATAPIATAPIEAEPVATAPIEAAPVEAAPIEAAPIEAAPVETAPIEAAPIEAAPIETAPVEAAPIEVAPVEAAPIETAPVEAAPIEVAPVATAQNDGVWRFADYDRDGAPDLIYIKTRNTGTNSVEVHVASYASGYKTRIWESGSTFAEEEDGTWTMADYDRDGILDLVFIKTANTPSGYVEVHVASGASGYKQRIFESATTFANENNGYWRLQDWDRDGVPDLIYIKTRNTGTNTVEVHVASGASHYQTRVCETGSTFAEEDDGDWTMADYDRDGVIDLVFLKTRNTGTNSVEVHVASAASGYKTRIWETGSTFAEEEDGSWRFVDWDRDGVPDLVFLKIQNTGTNSVEVHVASAASGYKTRVWETGSTFAPEGHADDY